MTLHEKPFVDLFDPFASAVISRAEALGHEPSDVEMNQIVAAVEAEFSDGGEEPDAWFEQAVSTVVAARGLM